MAGVASAAPAAPGGGAGTSVPGCPNAANAYHVCSARCVERIARQGRMCGEARAGGGVQGKHAGDSEGRGCPERRSVDLRWAQQEPSMLPGASPAPVAPADADPALIAMMLAAANVDQEEAVGGDKRVPRTPLVLRGKAGCGHWDAPFSWCVAPRARAHHWRAVRVQASLRVLLSAASHANSVPDTRTHTRFRFRRDAKYFMSGVVGAQRVACRDVCPPRAAAASPEPLAPHTRAQALVLPLADLIAYASFKSVAGHASAAMIERYERRGGGRRKPFQLDEWRLFGARGEATDSLGGHDGSSGRGGPPARSTAEELVADEAAASELRAHIAGLSLLPERTLTPGVGCHSLSVGPPGAQRALGRTRGGLMHSWHAQLRGSTQYVMYAPLEADLIGGGAVESDVSGFDPSQPDWSAYPRARAATPCIATLVPGEVLLVPAGWWWHRRHLEGEPAVVLRRDFTTLKEAPALLKDVQMCKERTDARRTAASAFTIAQDNVLDARCARNEGNEHFRRGAYRAATDSYTRALRLLGPDGDDHDDPECGGGGARAVYLCNRAACWLKRRRWAEARADCNDVLRSGRADKIAVKALFRRAKAFEGLGMPEDALRDYKRSLELEPGNKYAKEQVWLYQEIDAHADVIRTNAPGGRYEAQRKWDGDDV